MKVVWRSASMKPGELFVMMFGMIWMPLWFAQVSATHDSVRQHHFISEFITSNFDSHEMQKVTL